MVNVLRDDCKFVEIGEERYKINYMNPMVGVYIGGKLMAFLMPLINTFQKNNKGKMGDAKEKLEKVDLSGFDFSGIDLTAAFSAIPKADFMEIQTECLKMVQVELKSGWTNVLNENNSFAVHIGIKDMLQLIFEVLKFNLQDFFDGDPQK